jgi:hypothetical protein
LDIESHSMKNNRLFFVAFLFLLVTACSGEGGSASAPVAKGNSPAATADEAPQVDNEDLTPRLKGIDADANGIRDDVDRFIARHYSATSLMKKAAEQEARAFQKQVDAGTAEQALVAAKEVSRAADCTFKTLPHATDKDLKFAEDMSIEIKALTANTKERFEAYWSAQEMVSGTVFRDAKEPICD